MKLNILKLPEELFQYYRECTNGNEDITKDQAAKKLTRNVMSAMKVPPRNESDRLKGNQMYYYGNLHIVVKNDKIVHLHNHRGGIHWGGWFPNEDRHKELTKQLGIN